MDILPALTHTPGDDPRDAVLGALAGHPVIVHGKPGVHEMLDALQQLPERSTHRLLTRHEDIDKWLVLVVAAPSAYW